MTKVGCIDHLELANDIDQEMIRDINERRAELKTERYTLEQQLTETEAEIQRAPNPGLLDQLPTGRVNIDAMPEAMSRKLFEALRLEVHYNHETRKATCRITLIGETIDVVSQATHDSKIIPFPKTTTVSSKEEDAMTRNDVAPAVDGLRSALGRI